MSYSGRNQVIYIERRILHTPLRGEGKFIRGRFPEELTHEATHASNV
jgi:hypothetical protein